MKPLRIKDWSEDDRPREKLISKGRMALTDAELIAILIGSGSADESAVALSKRILKSVGNNLNELGKLGIEELKKFKGIGAAKAVTIASALELGRRRRSQEALERPTITSSKDAYELLLPYMENLAHEEFYTLYLNNAHKLITLEPNSRGGITGTVVDVRLILKKALECSATALILAHNHPSSSLQPSENDRLITHKIKKAAEQLDIKLLDHLIITDRAFYSFADENQL